jgi:hypothetical protein
MIKYVTLWHFFTSLGLSPATTHGEYTHVEQNHKDAFRKQSMLECTLVGPGATVAHWYTQIGAAVRAHQNNGLIKCLITEAFAILTKKAVYFNKMSTCPHAVLRWPETACDSVSILLNSINYVDQNSNNFPSPHCRSERRSPWQQDPWACAFLLGGPAIHETVGDQIQTNTR